MPIMIELTAKEMLTNAIRTTLIMLTMLVTDDSSDPMTSE